MEQLAFLYAPKPKRKRAARCPYCEKGMSNKKYLVAWMTLRDYVMKHQDKISHELLHHLVKTGPHSITLTPDLLQALIWEAKYEGTTVSELVCQIIDGYFYGEVNRLVRRGKKIKISHAR